MSMQTIQIDVSSDIFDKVMSFLEVLPKNKVHISKTIHPKKSQKSKESLVDFFQSSPLIGLELSREREVYQGRIKLSPVCLIPF